MKITLYCTLAFNKIFGLNALEGEMEEKFVPFMKMHKSRYRKILCSCKYASFLRLKLYDDNLLGIFRIEY